MSDMHTPIFSHDQNIPYWQLKQVSFKKAHSHKFINTVWKTNQLHNAFPQNFALIFSCSKMHINFTGTVCTATTKPAADIYNNKKSAEESYK